MKITVIVVGKTKATYIQEGIADYCKRLKHYCRIEFIPVREERITTGKSDGFIIQEETDRIREKLKQSSWVIALEIKGKPYSSESFAEFLSKRMSSGQSDLSFIIGGPLGLSQTLLSECNTRLSLSPMTLTHDMSRLVLLEQIYRAFTIINNEKYHK